jgi:hypothetical protein
MPSTEIELDHGEESLHWIIILLHWKQQFRVSHETIDMSEDDIGSLGRFDRLCNPLQHGTRL